MPTTDVLAVWLSVLFASVLSLRATVFCSRAAVGTVQLIDEPLNDYPTKEKKLIEEIYWRQRQNAEEHLATLKKSDFADSIAIRDNVGYPRKFIWDFYRADYNCPLRERIGNAAREGDGGKWICGIQTLLQSKDCVVYSFGSDGDTSFEEGILKHTPCQVHVFDPTLDWEQQRKVESIQGLTFHRFGLSDYNGVMRTDDPLSSMRKGNAVLPVKKLDTIMKELKHSWIDVLKLDIEGSEWPVLEQLLKPRKPLPLTQLQVEFHYWKQRGRHRPRQMLQILHELASKGQMRVFNVEPNIWWVNNGHDFVEYALIQVDAKGDIVTRQ